MRSFFFFSVFLLFILFVNGVYAEIIMPATPLTYSFRQGFYPQVSYATTYSGYNYPFSSALVYRPYPYYKGYTQFTVPDKEAWAPRPRYENTRCSDTDGDNPLTRGTVRVQYGFERSDEEFTDICAGDFLHEYACNPNTKTHTIYRYNCPSGCFRGTCPSAFGFPKLMPQDSPTFQNVDKVKFPGTSIRFR